MKLVFISLIFFSLNASAHQLHSSVTEALLNQRTGNLEISHRFYLHDAEHAANKLFDVSSESYDINTLPHLFGKYVQQGFIIKNKQSKKLDLNFLGIQVEGKFIYILQEMPLEKLPEQLSISFSVLTEVWANQSNVINFIYNKKVHSLVFDRNTTVQEFDLTNIAH